MSCVGCLGVGGWLDNRFHSDPINGSIGQNTSQQNTLNLSKKKKIVKNNWGLGGGGGGCGANKGSWATPITSLSHLVIKKEL